MVLYPGLVLLAVEAQALFTTAQAKVGSDLIAHFDSLDCEVCGDVEFTFEGPHSEGCYTVRECKCRVVKRLGLSETQASRLAEIYPLLSLESAYELWQARKADRRRFAEAKAEMQARRDFEGDVPALGLAVDGFFDVFYEEFSPSETVGPEPRWTVETTLTDRVVVSPGSLHRAVFALLVALYVPAIRASALRNCAVQLDEALVVADGFRDVTTMYDGTDDRDLGDDVLPWLHRDPSSRAILSRWNRPDDELEFMEEIRDTGRESEWWELMVDFRRRKLDALLKLYFGLDDYRASMIVLKWERSASSGRWKPAQQMNVVDWVKWSCEQSGSILGGLQSCTRSIQVKTQLRKRKEAAKARA